MGKKNYGSVYGKPYQRFRYILKYIEEYYKRKTTILIPNAYDGQHVLTSITRGYTVDCYESVDEFINGGKIDNFKIVGLKEKIDYFKFNDKVNVFSCNFYEQKINQQYEFVYCYKSLHLARNKDISMNKKIEKLLSAVKENGFIYIHYHLAKNEHDYINYPKNQYFRKCEMIKYFDDSWEIIFLRERNNVSKDIKHPLNNKEHTHLIGSILARKKYNCRKYKYNYKITTATEFDTHL